MLREQAAAIQPEIVRQVRIAEKSADATWADVISRERLVLSAEPLPAVVTDISTHLPSGPPSLDHVFVVARPLQRILKQYVFRDDDQETLSRYAFDGAVVAVRGRQDKSSSAPIVFAPLKSPAEIGGLFDPPCSLGVHASISLSVCAQKRWAACWLEKLLALPPRTALLDTNPKDTLETFLRSGQTVRYERLTLEGGVTIDGLTFKLSALQDALVVLALASPAHVSAIIQALEVEWPEAVIPGEGLSPVEEIARSVALSHLTLDEPWFDFEANTEWSDD